jgi:hypothetical protein
MEIGKRYAVRYLLISLQKHKTEVVINEEGLGEFLCACRFGKRVGRKAII